MNIEDFLNLRGLKNGDTVEVDALALQTFIIAKMNAEKKVKSLKENVEYLKDENDKLFNKVIEKNDLLRKLSKNLKELENTSSKSRTLIKENEELKSNLDISKYLLERYSERNISGNIKLTL